MRSKLTDFAVSLVAVSFGGGILAAIPYQVPGATLADVSNMGSPAFFPILAGAFLVLCAAALALRTVLGQASAAGSDEDSPDAAGYKRLISVAVLLVVYLFAIRSIGMIVSSMVLIVVMAPLLNYGRWRVILAVALLCPLAVFVLFEKTLRILLPHGWGF